MHIEDISSFTIVCLEFSSTEKVRNLFAPSRVVLKNCLVATTDLEDDVLTLGQKKYIEAICFK